MERECVLARIRLTLVQHDLSTAAVAGKKGLRRSRLSLPLRFVLITALSVIARVTKQQFYSQKQNQELAGTVQFVSLT